MLAVVGWGGFRAYQLRQAARDVRIGVQQVNDHIRASQYPAARASLQNASRASERAQAAAHDPLWRLAAHVPLVGHTFVVATGMTDAMVTLTHEVLPGIAQAAEVVDPHKTVHGTTVTLAPFRQVAGPLTTSAQTMAQVLAQVRALPADAKWPVGPARTQLIDQLTPFSESVSAVAVGARVLPTMLGGDRPKHYFVAVQNSAEMRGTGGLFGAFGIFGATNGKVTLDRTGTDQELKNVAQPVVDLGADYTARYSRLAADRLWPNINLSPDFPSVGRTVEALWKQTETQPIDGVVAVDPVGLSYLLTATGPVTMPDRTTITAGNAVQRTLSEFYQRFQGPQAPRNEYMKETMRQAFTLTERGKANPATLLERLGRAVLEGHLQVYSDDPAIQAELARTRIVGALPTEAKGFLQVVTQNTGGNKLDYYVRRKISYVGRLTGRAVDVGRGPEPEEEGVITIVLTNNAPRSGLPAYVSLRQDLAPGTPFPLGQDKLWVSVYIGAGGQLAGAEVDGDARNLTSEVEQGLSVFSTEVTVDPAGGTTTLQLHVFQPVVPGQHLIYRVQPLAFPEKVTAVRR
ncbi:MAG: hypothetical protein JWM40_786 [Frankiales bacterium]|nr:hypothetical protein [Frankiales bacterium]